MSLLVLASGSSARRELLKNAGLSFEVVPSTVDERALEEPLLARGASPSEIASLLAVEKAREVSRRIPDAIVIGADQTLDLDGHRGTKSETREAAREQLARLAGRTHHLRSAVAVARNGEILWQHVDSAALRMRPLTADEIESYIARTDDSVLKSVGVYQLEGEGVRLFDSIEGSYFTILGLPLLPLLKYLREIRVIE